MKLITLVKQTFIQNSKKISSYLFNYIFIIIYIICVIQRYNEHKTCFSSCDNIIATLCYI